MNKQGIIFVVVLVGAFVIFNGLKNLSKEVSLKDWLSQAEGYGEAITQHQQTEKPILVLFYTDWCGSCKVLKADLLTSPDVKQFINDSLIAVKINPERDMDSANLATQFNVIGYPMLFVVQEKGQVVRLVRKTHRITSEQFIIQLQRAMNSL
ncbi:hypothetical protein MNBD_GAMMA03-150 [hydrothermal vent metagenome]|uniref:Thioredoxin domain-containing protein n=1 Tax=hydrothermal vent metagenome TaxID=652676 RepID=A0A3B0W8W3_9ZZZZ